jgi:uncharacterized membrane protein
MKHEQHKSSFGLDANIVVIFVWFGGTLVSWIKPIAFLAIAVPFVIYLMESKSDLVKSHALQAIALFFATLIAYLVFLLIPILWLFIWVIPLINFLVSIIAVMKGYAWKDYEVPLIQPIVKTIQKIFGQ